MLARDAPANARAYEYFLRANELASEPKSWSIARDLYEQALNGGPALCPGVGGARARPAPHRQAWRRHPRTTSRARRPALARALELNPDQPLAHNVTAQLDIDRGHAREAMVRLIGQAARRRNGCRDFRRPRLRVPVLRSAGRIEAGR